MAEIRHRAFIHQPNGFIVISNGVDEVIYPSESAFRIDESGYALPDGAVALNFEIRGARDFLHIQMEDGSLVIPEKIDRPTREYYEGLIDSVSIFKSNIAAREHAALDARPLSDKRFEAYERNGLTMNRIVEALYDAIAEGNTNKLNIYKAERESFRTGSYYPKT